MNWSIFKRSALTCIITAAAVAGFGWKMSVSGATETKTVVFDSAKVKARDVPPIIGAGVHFGIGGEYGFDPAKSAKALQELGLKSYRDDLPWDMFDWPDSSYYKVRKARVFEMMRLAGGRPVLIVGGPNPTVPGGNPPLTDNGRTAFAGYAGRAARATQSFGPIYEIWNEWNMNAIQGKPWLRGPGEASDPRAAVNYVALAKAAVPAIKRVEPAATVLVGAVGIDDGWAWTRAMVDMGALTGADGLSVHLYNHCEANLADRTTTQMVNRLDDLQDFLTRKNGGTPYPVYVTEFGWPTVPRQCIITPKAAADNIAQFILWSATAPWLKGEWIYSLKNQGRNPQEMEDNFGLYDYDYDPKPASCTTREASAIVTAPGASFALERPFPDVFVIYGKSEKGLQLIAWTSQEEVKARISEEGHPFAAARPICGSPLPSNTAAIEIGPTPVVIDLSAGSASIKIAR